MFASDFTRSILRLGSVTMLIESKTKVTAPVGVIVEKLKQFAGDEVGYMKSYFIVLYRDLETNEEGIVNPLGLFFAMHLATDSLAKGSQAAVRKQIPMILEAMRDSEIDELVDETQKIVLACGLLVRSKSMKSAAVYESH